MGFSLLKRVIKMDYKNPLHTYIVVFAFILFCSFSYSQEIPRIKFLDEETINQVKIDYDKDGDKDLIIVGVYVKKNQGRVYIVKNEGLRYAKPEYIFSFPTIGFKQSIETQQDNDITTIIVIGTSPTGKQKKFTLTLFKGEYEGLLIPPVSSGK